jgi:glutamate-1-semialdehyde-2,1-aminomutase
MPKLIISESEKLYQEAQEYIPGGVIGIRRPLNFVPGEYPIFLERGEGGRVWDPDGNEYIDLLCAYGPVILGHHEKELDDAVSEQMKKGFCFNLAQKWQNELAKKVIELVPCAEQCFFVKTGSDATTASVRLARAYTGRNKILQHGYHGWGDWCAPVHGGIPEAVYKDTIPFPYNDLGALEKLIDENRDEVAAIIMTPLSHELNHAIEKPQEGYLEGVRELATKKKIVLIFDEVRTGFRVDMGGVQAKHNVTPDMCTMGKGMANGYAIATVMGKKEIMQPMTEGKVFISSTYFPNSLEMVAALKTIEILERENALAAIWEKGKSVMEKIEKSIADTGAKAELSGIPPMWFITFPNVEGKESKLYRERRIKFFTECIRQGLFMQPYHHAYIAYRHTEKDLNGACQIIHNSLETVAKDLSLT